MTNELQFLEAKNPALLFSGGLDSSVLLYLLKGIYPNLTVIQFRSDFRPPQKQFTNDLIKQWDLEIISFQPYRRFIIPNDKGLSLVDDYRLNGEIFPVVRDFIHDNNYCALELDTKRTDNFFYDFDVTFVGWRKSDDASILGTFKLPQSVTIGNSLFYAPLFDKTDAEVQKMAKDLNIPLSEYYESKDEKLSTNKVVCCSNCLQSTEKAYCPKEKKEIDAVFWHPSTNLEYFQQRFK